MDPFSLVVGLGLTVGALFIDIRGVDFLQKKIDQALSEKAKKTTFIVEQPTEKFTIDFTKEV